MGPNSLIHDSWAIYFFGTTLGTNYTVLETYHMWMVVVGGRVGKCVKAVRHFLIWHGMFEPREYRSRLVAKPSLAVTGSVSVTDMPEAQASRAISGTTWPFVSLLLTTTIVAYKINICIIIYYYVKCSWW